MENSGTRALSEADQAALIERLRPEVAARLRAIYELTHRDSARFARPSHMSPNARIGLQHLARAEPHDPDYVVLRHILAADGIVIDAGANSGQSAASVWAAGSDAAVLSIEPLPFHRETLDAIKRARPHRFDYRLVALSDRDGELELLVPSAYGHSASWLASVASEPEWDKLGLTVAMFIVRRHYREGKPIDVDLAFVRVPARRLDALLADEPRPVAVIKIDVEGHETEVIAGAADTLANQRPLLLIERAQNRPAMLRALLVAGYRYGRRDSDRLIPADGPNDGRNTFLWHASKESDYRRRGLLAEA